MESQIILQDQPLRDRLKVTNPKFCSNPTRRNKQIEGQFLKSEMMGAGTDPLAKDQHFSSLASDPNLLINSLFQKPPFAKIRFPPILDNYSRTLANPICTQKYNLSESARVGSNFSKTAQPLYIDIESKCIRVAKDNETKVVFTANANLLQPVASRTEELLVFSPKYVLDDELMQELQVKVASKLVCYERYKSYIENEINLDQVAPIRQYWITDILDLIPADFPHMKREVVEQMIDAMLTEINKFYY
jgi:dynein heavy chain